MVAAERERKMIRERCCFSEVEKNGGFFFEARANHTSLDGGVREKGEGDF